MYDFQVLLLSNLLSLLIGCGLGYLFLAWKNRGIEDDLCTANVIGGGFRTVFD